MKVDVVYLVCACGGMIFLDEEGQRIPCRYCNGILMKEEAEAGPLPAEDDE